jgi:ribose transport system substrate-binding protein
LLIAQPFGQKGGVVPGAEVDPEPVPPVEVTGSTTGAETCDLFALRTEQANGYLKDCGYVCMEATRNMSDERLDGEVTTMFTHDKYGDLTDEETTIGTVAVSIENADGAWRGRPEPQVAFAWGSVATNNVTILDGEGADESLVAVLEIPDGPGGERGYGIGGGEIRGYIFDAGYPEPPAHAAVGTGRLVWPRDCARNVDDTSECRPSVTTRSVRPGSRRPPSPSGMCLEEYARRGTCSVPHRSWCGDRFPAMHCSGASALVWRNLAGSASHWHSRRMHGQGLGETVVMRGGCLPQGRRRSPCATRTSIDHVRRNYVKRLLTITSVALLTAAMLPAATVAQDDMEKPNIAFLPGILDPFYQVMETGINKAAEDFGIEVQIAQYPDTWGTSAQNPILSALKGQGNLDYLITAPVSTEEMIAPLQEAVDQGTKIITVDTFLADGDYVNGPVTFPISYIGSDNVEGGRISCNAIAEAIGGSGKVYIQNTNADVSSVMDRSQGCREALAEYPDIEIVDEQYNGDVEAVGVQQTEAVLQLHPDLAGIFGVNVFSAQGAGEAVKNAGLGGEVQIVAYDATQRAIELLRNGDVTMVLAQKPFDMGYMGVEFAMADAAGVTSLPKHVTTGFAIIDADNVDDPEYARYIYQVD